MTTRSRSFPARRALIVATGVVVLGAGLFAAGGFAQGKDDEAAAVVPALHDKSVAAQAVGPDVVVFGFDDGVWPWGQSNGFVGYSVGTVSCNRGDTPLNWCAQSSGCAPGATSANHPAIGQNLYRLKDGRLEQIGMSWLKHGFTSLNQSSGGCTGSSGGGCQSPPFNGNQLGIGCTDPYSASLNGSRTRLGPHQEVNATTGALVIPHSTPGSTTVWEGRLKVATTDVDPTVNPDAGSTSAGAATKYFAEAQYIAGDDAMGGNGLNNASYQRVTVGASPSFPLTRTGSFFEQKSAIYAWPAQDPTVTVVTVDVPGSSPVERYQVARKVTDLGGGFWHYEYAVRNHNSERSARAFTVTFPVATTFSGIGFKDAEHHSGEPYATTDWSVSTTGTDVSWFTDIFTDNANANALRFTTMYNFWFDADQPPFSGSGNAMHTVGLFKPGTPDSVTFDGFNTLFNNGFEAGSTGAWSGAN
ncbi:MAG TPA: hypothetical protein VGS57_05215 [Thermoanaerobaculia bacterium]|jgi:hypothetical protein|nr:hypothetical protein [Thermoanaerobaculia bacterium]